MSDNPLDSIQVFDRVSIRAVLVNDGEDPSAALAEAGIIDAVAIPVVFGDSSDLSGSVLGDGMTDNPTGVLEPDQEEEDDVAAASDSSPAQRPDGGGQARPGTASLPDAYGLSPLAPVRPRGG